MVFFQSKDKQSNNCSVHDEGCLSWPSLNLRILKKDAFVSMKECLISRIYSLGHYNGDNKRKAKACSTSFVKATWCKCGPGLRWVFVWPPFIFFNVGLPISNGPFNQNPLTGMPNSFGWLCFLVNSSYTHFDNQE